MNSTSPPAPVTARPVATPGTAVRDGRLLEELLAAERVADDLRRRSLTGGSTLPDAIRVAVLRSTRPELTLELADAGLARVLGDDRAQQRRRRSSTSSSAQAVALAAGAATGSRRAIATFSCSV